MKLFNLDNTKPNNLLIPAAWLSIADQIIIMILIPLVDKIVYPFLKNRLGIEICTRTRMILGMVFALLSVVIAGIVETTRMHLITNNSTGDNLIPQIIDNTTYIAANFSILWQVPQYTLVGMGEVFCSIAGLYFAYTAAPKSMQSIIMGLFYFFMGIGSLLGSLILYAFHGLVYSGKNHDDINCENCHLDFYFYFLGILQFFSIIIFVFIDRKYCVTKLKDEKSPCCGDSEQDKIQRYNRLPVSIRNRMRYNTINNISNSSINIISSDP
jgi:peptide/histidine transporter 3/4